jgi:hypothetical protein
MPPKKKPRRTTEKRYATGRKLAVGAAVRRDPEETIEVCCHKIFIRFSVDASL